MRAFSRSGFAAALLALPVAFAAGWSAAPGAQTSTPPARRLELKFNNGKVSLIAQGVTVREVMAEWARQCGCVVQGSDRLTGNFQIPVEFDDQPEAVVLESLLRGAGGYLLGPRAAGSHGASIYGRVAVFPVTRGIAAPNYSPYASGAAPIAAPLVSGGTPDDEIPPVTPVTNPETPAQTPGRPGGPAPTAPAGRGRSGGPPSAE